MSMRLSNAYAPKLWRITLDPTIMKTESRLAQAISVSVIGQAVKTLVQVLGRLRVRHQLHRVQLLCYLALLGSK